MIAKYKFHFIILVALVFLNSCSENKKEYILKVKLNKLTYNDMYDYNLVADVIFDSQELNLDSIQNISRERFLQGVDEYKNKHNPSAAITLFKASILYFPDAKVYYELGNALMEFKTNKSSLEESIKAYRVAEELEMKPLFSVFYKLACAQNLLDKLEDSENNSSKYEIISYLRSAFHNGFYDTSAIRKDDRINSIINTAAYKGLLLELEAEHTKGDKNSLFELFKAAFPRPKTDFEISKDQVDQVDNEEAISYDFSTFVPEMQNTSFGREVSNDFFYVATIKETPVYSALVYSSVSFWAGEELQPVFTSLVTYDPAGVIIDRKMISCQCSAEKIKTAKISDNNVYVEDYKRIWKQPIDKVSFEENSIDKYELLAKLTYTINDDGTIKATEIPADYKDTVIVKNQTNTTPR